MVQKVIVAWIKRRQMTADVFPIGKGEFPASYDSCQSAYNSKAFLVRPPEETSMDHHISSCWSSNSSMFSGK